MSEFIEVEVDEGDGIAEPVALRFKQVAPPQAVRRVHYDGGAGEEWWSVQAPGTVASTALVEDSSDGEARLIYGGLRGLQLTGERSGQRRREPYLLLARATRAE